VTGGIPPLPAIEPGERFTDLATERLFDEGGTGIWQTLGFRRTAWTPGAATVAWDAPLDYCFPSASGPVLQGGLVTALLDAAMGGATWTVLDRDQAFLTADLRVEFLRSTRPGLIHASAVVVRRTRKVIFAAADLVDDTGQHLASSRCTQVVLPADGPGGRYDAAPADGSPPLDGRG